MARWINPSRDRLCRRFGLLSDEAFGVSAEGAIERGLTGGMDSVDLAVVHLVEMKSSGSDFSDVGTAWLATQC